MDEHLDPQSPPDENLTEPTFSSAELWSAPTLTFDRPAASRQARTLATRLVSRIEEKEQASGARQRARSPRQRQALRDAIRRFLGGLALSVERDNRPPVGCPKRAGAFTDKPLGFRTFMDVYQRFLDLGLIEVVSRGSWERIPEFGPQAGRGRNERIRTTEELVTLCASTGSPKALSPSTSRGGDDPSRSTCGLALSAGEGRSSGAGR